ncbi:hemolysin family protein [Cryptosporangium aurantiacum]|uniref:Hemolysin, contains CBS domains n=1 Tax=Cryptosporangium aurantiacum TaxID=134849 RepID=A0A1M7QU64_9ACTN|nr:hemolysin family protein [Cryptosporangium aurantiacum]SHN35222.1 Hemolysin, contains CBS domains [Cryptosporangium aurantiacum]
MTAAALVAVLVFLAANAVFVAAEFSLTSVDRPRVQRLADSGNDRAAGVLAALRSLSFQLSGSQLGITVSSLVLGYLAEPSIGRLLDPAFEAAGLSESVANTASYVVALILATAVQTVFGELVPKNAAVAEPLRTAYVVAPIQRAFSSACKPLILLLNGSANWVIRKLGIEPQDELGAGRSRAELGSLIRASAEQGALAEGTARLVRRSLAFDDRTVADVLTPRTKVRALAAHSSVADLATQSRRTGFSRFPVFEHQLDNLLGVVHVKAVFRFPDEERARTSIREVIEPLGVLPETLELDEALGQLRREPLQMSAVIDEYGGLAGVVTLEDLIEELVGEVRDEHDRPPEPDIVPLGRDEWRVSGLLRDDAAATRLCFNVPSGPYETLAGLFLDRAGKVPEVGDAVRVEDAIDPAEWELTVEQMDAHRIASMRLVRTELEPRDE